MLDADKATQDDDRDHELIDDREIPGDEIGQIMRSRNLTILQLRKHEEDLQDAMRRLEAQDRLVHLGLMSASVAHELNTPLSVLQGSIEKTHPKPRRMRWRSIAWPACCGSPSASRRSAKVWSISRGHGRMQMGPVPMQPLITESWGLVSIDEKAASVRFTNKVDPEAWSLAIRTAWFKCS